MVAMCRFNAKSMFVLAAWYAAGLAVMRLAAARPPVSGLPLAVGGLSLHPAFFAAGALLAGVTLGHLVAGVRGQCVGGVCGALLGLALWTAVLPGLLTLSLRP